MKPVTNWRSRRFLIPVALFVMLALAASLPADVQTTAVKQPITKAKMRASSIRLEPAAEKQILAVTRDLTAKMLPDKLAKSVSSLAETNILQKLPQGYLAEAIVHTLRKDIYTAEMSRLEFKFIDGQASDVKVTKDFKPAAAKAPVAAAKNPGLLQKKNSLLAQGVVVQPGAAPSSTAVGLANTPCDWIDSAVKATNDVHEIFRKKFGDSVKKLIGDESTEAELLKYLKNDANLVVWNNIGHGSTSGSGQPCYGLLQSDGTVTDEEFADLSPSQGLFQAVVLTNSCNSFKDPLLASIWSRGPRAYIGGNINLPIGRSEPVDVLFWENALNKNMTMAAALNDAQQQNGFPVGTFGLKGETGVFSTSKMPDLGIYGFLKIGKKKREVKWNETIVLTPDDATSVSGGKPTFEVYYSYKDFNEAGASGFQNCILFNDKEVSRQTNQSVGPKEIREVNTTPYLGPLEGKLQVKIDANNSVPETREDNNFNFFVTIKFQGFK